MLNVLTAQLIVSIHYYHFAYYLITAADNVFKPLIVRAIRLQNVPVIHALDVISLLNVTMVFTIQIENVRLIQKLVLFV